jgi:hypothetical protein
MDGQNWQVTVVPVNGALIDSSLRVYRNVVTGSDAIPANNGSTPDTGNLGGTHSVVGTQIGQMAGTAGNAEIAKSIAHELVGHGGGLLDPYDTTTGITNPKMIGNLMNNDPSNGLAITGDQLKQMLDKKSGNEIVIQGGDTASTKGNHPVCILGIICF